MKRALLMVMVVALLVTLLSGCSEKTLVMGVVPSQNAEKIMDTAKPLADLLAKELGMKVEAVVTTNYVGLIEGMGSKSKPIDIGFLPPFAYVLAHDENGAEVILKSVRNKATSYRAQFITHVDNTHISTLADIKPLGKIKFGLQNPSSASGYLYPFSHLKQMGINPDTDLEVVNVVNHDGAVERVYHKDVLVSVCFEDARTRVVGTLPDVFDKVKVIDYTTGIPNDTFSVRKGMKPELKDRITAAILKIAETDEGKKLLKDLYDIDGFAAAKNADYDVIRNMLKDLNINVRDRVK